jgi:FkbM family methyltransferase
MELNSNLKDKYQKRILLATECEDCQDIPKVNDAGNFVGKAHEFQCMHNGILIKRGSYHGEWMSDLILKLKGHHEPQEERVFHEVLSKIQPGATMVELGSFWAYYSLWFKHQIPNSQSILVEPNKAKLAVGKDHFLLNKMEATFIQAFIGSACSDYANFIDWDGKKTLMKMISIDGLRSARNIDVIDLLHADIQGAEFEMLKGASKSLESKKINYLFISTHGCEHERCIRFLKKNDYQIIAQHSILESYSSDGLIVAHSPRINHFQVDISRRSTSFIDRVKYHLGCLKRTFLR